MGPSKNICIRGIVACLLWVLGSTSPLHAFEIRIMESATVLGEVVRLGDVAVFEPGDDQRVRQLKEVQLASAPIPGSTLTLNSRFLIYRIGSAVSGMDDVKLKIPDGLVVQREGQVVGASQLEGIFRTHVTENAPWDSDRMTFEKIVVPGPITLPHGSMRWEVRKKRGEEYVGDVSLVVAFWVDGKQVRKVSVSGRVLVDQEVLRTARRIGMGEVLDRDDLVQVTERQAHLKSNAMTDIEEAVGKRATRTIQAEQILERNMIEDPPLVRKGDRVVIRAESKAVTVTAVGKVLQDGRTGDHVRVINIGSGREILGTVQGPGQVGVTF